MHERILNMVRAAIIAALYVVLTHFQNILLPGSASWAIQCRLSETLCILAFFTPAAIPGLTIGCLLFNITFAGALPLDWLVGSFATLIAAQIMWHLRNVKVHGLPALGLLMPALTNAILVGYELTLFIGGGFWINAFYVALGELIVLLIPGSLLYVTMRHRNLDTLLFL
ncbi:MAG: QueT transporter family protein [Oscillospiraceae bacterium]|nr:QueT transporter family protein [Oscillospiraceae bacterium]